MPPHILSHTKTPEVDIEVDFTYSLPKDLSKALMKESVVVVELVKDFPK